MRRSFNNIVVPREKIIGPLATCASFISGAFTVHVARRIMRPCRGQHIAFTVCQEFRHGSRKGQDRPPAAELSDRRASQFRQSEHLQSGAIAAEAAVHLGISPRYVHKLFAGSALTFSCYVTARRLDHIRRELASPPAAASRFRRSPTDGVSRTFRPSTAMPSSGALAARRRSIACKRKVLRPGSAPPGCRS